MIDFGFDTVGFHKELDTIHDVKTVLSKCSQSDENLYWLSQRIAVQRIPKKPRSLSIQPSLPKLIHPKQSNVVCVRPHQIGKCINELLGLTELD